MSKYKKCLVKLNDSKKASNKETEELIIYTTVSNLGSRNAVEWFTTHEVDFVHRKVNIQPLTKEEILEFLSYTENGFDDLLSFPGRQAQLEDIPLSKAIDVLIKHPRYIKKPIIFNHKIVQVGFIKGEVHAFIPRNQRAKYYMGV